MSCPKHPTYTGTKRPPSGECSVCWRLWYSIYPKETK